MTSRALEFLSRNLALTAAATVVLLGVFIVSFPEGATAMLIVIVLSGITILAIQRSPDPEFLTQVFVVGLVLRLGFGLFVHVADLRDFFGGDAATYDSRGFMLAQSWGSTSTFVFSPDMNRAVNLPGWGMNYLVGVIYYLFGRNIYAAQCFCGVIGAATAPLVYVCSIRVFENRQAAKLASIGIAVAPAFVIWSGQLLKDGLIVFLLVLAMIMVLDLQKRFNLFAVAVLAFSMFGILSLRFYIFYMIAVAVGGSFLLGTKTTGKAVVARLAAMLLIGLAFTYFGVTNIADRDIQRYGDLREVQRSRLDLARSGDSGFSEESDVSTTEGAIATLPIGLTYLMLAPFPWEARNIRQAITIPETLIWWSMIPLIIIGLAFTVRYRLRAAFPILVFSLLLTIAYSLFQGNVGTAYRQRTQIQVFLFIFAAVGWQVFKERREDKRILNQGRKRRLEQLAAHPLLPNEK